MGPLRRSTPSEVVATAKSDGWWAESPDVEGWSAAGESYVEVVRLAEEGIPVVMWATGAEGVVKRPYA